MFFCLLTTVTASLLSMRWSNYVWRRLRHFPIPLYRLIAVLANPLRTGRNLPKLTTTTPILASRVLHYLALQVDRRTGKSTEDAPKFINSVDAAIVTLIPSTRSLWIFFFRLIAVPANPPRTPRSSSSPAMPLSSLWFPASRSAWSPSPSSRPSAASLSGTWDRWPNFRQIRNVFLRICQNSNKRGGGKDTCCLALLSHLFCSHKYDTIKFNFVFDLVKKKIGANLQRIDDNFWVKCTSSSQNYGLRSMGHKGTGSGSATLVRIRIFSSWSKIIYEPLY